MSQVHVETINLNDLLKQEITRRGFIFERIDTELPSIVKVTCGLSIDLFVVTDDLIRFAYPGLIIYKPDLEIVKEKIRISFFELSEVERKLINEFFDRRPADNLNSKLPPVKKEIAGIKLKIRRSFLGKYRPGIIDYEFKAICDLKRNDFIIIKFATSKKVSFDDTKKKLYWQTALSYTNWTPEEKEDCIVSFFKNDFKAWF